MEEVRPIIRVDVGDSQKTVKGLKDEIKILQDHILNLEKGSKEYNDAVKKLQDDQRELNQVMSLTKKEATALDGSYDSLVHQMSLLKKEWRATNDEAKRNELGKQIDEINSQLKELDGSIGNFQRNVGNYESALDGLSNAGMTFNEQMSKMREEIEPTKMKFESVANIASGLASGFAAVKGAMALLGVENENLEKTFVSLQAAMALAQGIGGLTGLVEGIGKAKVAFNSLNGVIKVVNKTMGKTGWLLIITAVVTAIAALVGWIKNKNKAAKDARESIDALADANERLSTSQERANRELEREINIMKAEGASEAEILKKRKEAYQRQIAEWQEKIREYELEYLKASNAGLKKEELEPILDNIQAATNEIIELQEKIKDVDNSQAVLTIKMRTEYENERKAANDRRDKLVQDFLNSEIDIEDEEIVIDSSSPQLQGEGEIHKHKQAAMAAIDKTYSDLAKKNGEDVAEYEIQIEERKLERLKELHQQAIDAKDYTSQILLAQDIADQEIAVNEAKNDAIIKSEEKRKNKQIEVMNEVSAALAAAGSITQGILEITQAAAEKDGEISEKEAKRIKGLQIAIATMNMLAGITAALSGAFTSKSGPWDIALAAVQAASIAASGTANIMKIKNTDLTGKVSSGAMAAVTPNSNVFGTDLPMSYVRNVTTASETDRLNQDTKVYVLESDITDAVNRQQVRVQEASF